MGGKSQMKTVAASLEELTSRLTLLTDTPQLDAQVLLARAMERPRAWLQAHPRVLLDLVITTKLETSIKRLEQGEPLPYVIGEWEFFSLPFDVTSAVLIPRPETELLVERAIAWLRKWKRGLGMCTVLDVGTGCGCIAISLAVNIPEIQVVATDISPTALEIARRNACKLGVQERIAFLQADLVPIKDQSSYTTENYPPSIIHIPQSYDMIVANLPYIPTLELHHLPISKQEPIIALDGGDDGLSYIRHLLTLAPQLLTPDGLILLEIEASQGSTVLSLAYDAFTQAAIHLHQDLAGKDRMLEIQL
jgi:release factor glutamine methyltransferase